MATKSVGIAFNTLRLATRHASKSKFESGYFRSHFPRRNITTSAMAERSLPTEAKAVEETQDVNTMDKLLRVVREMANPAYHNIMPLRKPMLWSEALLNATSSPETSEGPTPAIPASSDSLPPRKMHDSYTQFTLPFASSPELLEQYTNASGGLRTGMLMEHLDSLAGSISYCT
ncbi:hypothetical protein SERLA73DRAFT_176301 [Serpula lacrymans var. lacrymans S7.3]|uniref:Uncharacterized protein n=2 Tax=Serpula lacrymans var. lacrymans TaxID=341189 RepID=F8PMN5_SERL3|nr:uncharacterized protein SERLADRAFT_459127 [Serpula lacrymans var. lacrymans S7.9]EGO02867.1 hypothetical protein SERLA73DRAFT_176301 [Serpula lacrymans var. lacrymans S7.3]EGO28560.1 hypothetical protein SERLADRAFT_459127 [Serpula lacrymans var. lacrymans S7.9]